MTKMGTFEAKLHTLMANKNMLYLFVFLVLICETSAMSFLKQYSITGSFLALGGGLACYFLVCIFFEFSLRYEGMGMVNILWSAFSVIFVVVTGVLLFGEHVSGIQMVGIGLVITGVVFLRSGDGKKKGQGGQCVHVIAAELPKLSSL